MKRTTTILLCLVCLLYPLISEGQDFRKPSDAEKIPAGIGWSDWGKMEKRWQPYATRITIQKTDGTTLEGQLTWMDDSRLIVQKNYALPGGLTRPDDFATIPVSDIASVKVRLGGHPYKGLIIGMLAGAIPGVVTGLILAQGWTVIPAIVFGVVTAGGGGALGSVAQKVGRKQSVEIQAGELHGRTYNKLKKSALFPHDLPAMNPLTTDPTLTGFDQLVSMSSALQQAFPINPWAISIHSSILTNSVRKRLQNWYMSPLWGPPDPYYETRIGIEADVSRRIGKRFQAGALVQFFPGDISSAFFNKHLPEWNVSYSYNHHFNQTTAGIYGGWLLHPADRYWADRLEASIQVGAVLSDVYEHFYFQWNAVDNYSKSGETFIREHYLQPGAMMRLKTSWYLIPGFSVDAGLEGYLLRRVQFPERTVLPETAYGPTPIGQHRLNFSNVQGFVGIAVHL